jgi:hypothetical protein
MEWLVMLIALALGCLVLYTLWRPRYLEPMENEEDEDFKTYDNNDKLLQNESNIQVLKEKMDNILSLKEQVETLQVTCDANTQSIQGLLDTCGSKG